MLAELRSFEWSSAGRPLGWFGVMTISSTLIASYTGSLRLGGVYPSDKSSPETLAAHHLVSICLQGKEKPPERW